MNIFLDLFGNISLLFLRNICRCNTVSASSPSPAAALRMNTVRTTLLVSWLTSILCVRSICGNNEAVGLAVIPDQDFGQLVDHTRSNLWWQLFLRVGLLAHGWPSCFSLM